MEPSGATDSWQIIVGNEVTDIYDAVCEKGGFQKEEAIDENLDGDVKEKRGIKDLLGVFMETLSSIFAPFIPAIVACGLLQGLLYSVQSLGWLDSTTDTYTFFFTCSQAAFYFLPILVAFSAGKRFKCNPYLAATTAAILMHPAFAGMAGTTIKLFGFIPITYAGYSSTVIPAILTVYFQSHVERLCKRVVPKMIDIIVTPLVSVLVSAVAGWLVLGAHRQLGRYLCGRGYSVAVSDPGTGRRRAVRRSVSLHADDRYAGGHVPDYRAESGDFGLRLYLPLYRMLQCGYGRYAPSTSTGRQRIRTPSPWDCPPVSPL